MERNKKFTNTNKFSKVYRLILKTFLYYFMQRGIPLFFYCFTCGIYPPQLGYPSQIVRSHDSRSNSLPVATPRALAIRGFFPQMKEEPLSSTATPRAKATLVVLGITSSFVNKFTNEDVIFPRTRNPPRLLARFHSLYKNSSARIF